MAWHARLRIDWRHDGGRSTARHRHEGPLRVLQSLYPEGPGVCHNVLVHPPSGLVGGDVLDIAAEVHPGAHAVVTTPGATRFYRSEGAPAVQRVQLTLAAGARCEWLPLEAICYSGCLAENHVSLQLAPGAELIGWDVVALGLPAAGQPFQRGRLLQHLAWPGHWLERGVLDAGDAPLMDGPLGLAGRRCLATLFLASGTPWPRERREQALELARALLPQGMGDVVAGATALHPQLVVVRVLAPVVEPAMRVLQAVRAAWRPALWALPTADLRSWSV